MVTLEARIGLGHVSWARPAPPATTIGERPGPLWGQFNTQVDLLGALGELFLLSSARAAKRSEEAVAYYV